ncbi:hypothetical protein CK203_077709 [Vitis vinifera]|uniref:Uncharacterized protein n=1 Tax=Vitis vinifera TaxID=29760 RepID=A0A438BXC0_VITVI|nr:hypothetical protein CK203_077709 [Vitis vinifera]
MFEPTYTERPSTQPSFTEPPQAPLTPDHAPWMDLSAHISSLSTHMEELAIVSDSRFYSMENCMDQYQFEHLQQRIERIEDCLESQHEKIMVYLRSVFPFPSS